MWTLILYTMLVSTAPAGGVHSTTTALSFNSKEQCDAALNTLIAVPTVAVFDNGNRQVGVFRTVGHCVSNSK
jgi:hypothetical protein